MAKFVSIIYGFGLSARDKQPSRNREPQAERQSIMSGEMMDKSPAMAVSSTGFASAQIGAIPSPRCQVG